MTDVLLPHIDDVGDWVCQHGTAMDVHCCNCHSGFLFDIQTCHCGEDGHFKRAQSGDEPGEA